MGSHPPKSLGSSSPGLCVACLICRDPGPASTAPWVSPLAEPWCSHNTCTPQARQRGMSQCAFDCIAVFSMLSDGNWLFEHGAESVGRNPQCSTSPAACRDVHLAR